MMKRFISLSYGVYALSAVLLLCGMLSLIACHQNISAQLRQGVPLQGNELAILNLYLQSCTQYIALSVLLYLGGRSLKDREVTHIILEKPSDTNSPNDMRKEASESDDADDDWIPKNDMGEEGSKDDDTDDDWIPEGYTEES